MVLVSDHIYRTLSHKENSDLTFTYLESLSKVQHSGRANHNMGNGQELQPCLPVSKGQHLTDERVLDSFFFLCGFVSLPFLKDREREKTVFCLSLLTLSIPVSQSPSAHSTLWHLLLVTCPIYVNLSQHFQRKCCLIISKSYCFWLHQRMVWQSKE